MKQQILEEIEKLKLMVMLDDGIDNTYKTKYKEWVDELLLRGKYAHVDPFDPIKNPRKYATYQTIRSLVGDLYYELHKHEFEYCKNEPEIHRIIADVVSMTMFYQEKMSKKK